MPAICVVACLKWIDRRPVGDGVVADERFSGMSPADEAALEWALRAGSMWGCEVVAVTVGRQSADLVLRAALAAGASRGIRVDDANLGSSPDGAGPDSSTVARAIAGLTAAVTGDAVVWCGDYSLDRGTGSVPAFIAAELGVPQLLGLVELTIGSTPGEVMALRRLDGGRRERLRTGVGSSPQSSRPSDVRAGLTGAEVSSGAVVPSGAVVSVEGSTARLRRAGLAAVMRARQAEIEVIVPTGGGDRSDEVPARTVRPFRPRPRVLPAPVGASTLDRVRALTDTAAAPGSSAGETVVLSAPDAARRILDALRGWGYLDG